jgi:hypothetical protein
VAHAGEVFIDELLEHPQRMIGANPVFSTSTA